MCFSQSASLGFGLLGLGTGLILWARGHPARRFTIFLWFAMMEFIQYLGYFVVDQCDNPWNKALAFAAFIHTLVQMPVLVWYLLSPDFGISGPDIPRLLIPMSAISAALLLLMRVPWLLWLGAPMGLLDGLAQRWPEFSRFDLAGSKEACSTEVSCGPQVCMLSTPNHIAWMVPLLPASYFAPTFWAHFCFVFLPPLILGNAAARFTMLVAFAALAATQMLAAGNAATYRLEWPSTWCYLSVAMCFVALASELYVIRASPGNDRDGRKASGQPHNAQRVKKE